MLLFSFFVIGRSFLVFKCYHFKQIGWQRFLINHAALVDGPIVAVKLGDIMT